ncbi:MAG: hypothetical protein IJ069_03770 [Prevotella sp.]|nr:hypothetical protein [Prevotella sp.]
MPINKEIVGSGIALKSHYHLTTISLPRQRLFFERFAFGYRRSVVWLEPFSCLTIGERLKGCFFTPRRTALIPQHPYPTTPTEGIFIIDARHSFTL